MKPTGLPQTGILLRKRLQATLYRPSINPQRQHFATEINAALGGVVQGQLLNGGPQVQDIAVGAALRLETLEDVFAQLDGAGRLVRGRVGRRLAMDGTGSAALLSRETETGTFTISALTRLHHWCHPKPE